MSGPMTQFGNETPTVTDIIREAIRQNQLELNTMLPAEIVSYDAATQTCTVQPSLKRTMIDPPEIVSRPEIEDVPVVFPRNKTGGIFFPLEKGDGVMLVFAQRSLDDWIDDGGEVQVRDIRLHDLTDAVAVPGFYPLSDKIDPPPAEDATEVRGDKVLLGSSDTTQNTLFGDEVLIGSEAAAEPFVLGDTLQGSLEDLIQAIKDLSMLITVGATLSPGVAAFGTPVISSIVTAAVDAALTAVETALPANNSTKIKGE